MRAALSRNGAFAPGACVLPNTFVTGQIDIFITEVYAEIQNCRVISNLLHVISFLCVCFFYIPII